MGPPVLIPDGPGPSPDPAKRRKDEPMNNTPETGKGDSGGSQTLSERKRVVIENLEMCRESLRKIEALIPAVRKIYDKFVCDHGHPGYPEKDITRYEEELREIEALEKVEGKVVLLDEYRPCPG